MRTHPRTVHRTKDLPPGCGPSRGVKLLKIHPRKNYRGKGYRLTPADLRSFIQVLPAYLPHCSAHINDSMAPLSACVRRPGCLALVQVAVISGRQLGRTPVTDWPRGECLSQSTFRMFMYQTAGRGSDDTHSPHPHASEISLAAFWSPMSGSYLYTFH